MTRDPIRLVSQLHFVAAQFERLAYKVEAHPTSGDLRPDPSEEVVAEAVRVAEDFKRAVADWVVPGVPKI